MQSLRGLARFEVGPGPADVVFRVLPIELDRRVQVGDGAVVVLFGEVGDAAVAVGFGKFRVDVDRFVFRVERDCLIIVGDGAVILSLGVVGMTTVAVGGGKSWV